MTDDERKLLTWCAIMLVRSSPPTPDDADEIDQLIADVRSPRSQRIAARAVEIERGYIEAMQRDPKLD